MIGFEQMAGVKTYFVEGKPIFRVMDDMEGNLHHSLAEMQDAKSGFQL